MTSMTPNAVALLRPRSLQTLSAHLDHEEARMVDFLYDGSVLYRTGIPYPPMTFDELIARAWLTGFGDDLEALHDDARGVLFFPETLRFRGTSYRDIVREVGYAGIWVQASTLSLEEQYEQHVALTLDIKRYSSAPPRF
jgi:hypothetical protein